MNHTGEETLRARGAAGLLQARAADRRGEPATKLPGSLKAAMPESWTASRQHSPASGPDSELLSEVAAVHDILASRDE